MTTHSEDRKISHHPSLDQIMQNLRAHLPQLREEYNIRYVWLFGSFVRGKQHRHSDLDVLVEFEETPTLPKFISLEQRLREITGIKVYLVYSSPEGRDRGAHLAREGCTVNTL